jgi:hypothetical protein
MKLLLRERPNKPVNPKAYINHSFTSDQKKIIWNWFYENERKRAVISKDTIINLFQRAKTKKKPQIGASIILPGKE